MDNEQEKKKGGEKMNEQKQTEVTVKSKVNVTQGIGIAVAVLAIIAGITGAAFALFAQPQPPSVDSGSPCTGPGSFTLSTPVNAASNQDDAVLLQWSTSSRATSYDVYLGKTIAPSKVATVTTTSYNATQLSISTTYYWKIVARNSCTTRSSSIWSFATAGWGFFQAQGYNPSEYSAACGGNRGCDADNTTLSCAEFNDVWLICSGTTNKCPDNLEDKCIQQSVCQCAGVAADGQACTDYWANLTNPCQ